MCVRVYVCVCERGGEQRGYMCASRSLPPASLSCFRVWRGRNAPHRKTATCDRCTSGMIVARMSLWLYDLAVTQLFQEWCARVLCVLLEFCFCFVLGFVRNVHLCADQLCLCCPLTD